jgi:hypothetical protein
MCFALEECIHRKKTQILQRFRRVTAAGLVYFKMMTAETG